MADPLEERFAGLVAARANAPFGDTDLKSGQVLQPFSQASHDMAANLLAKAVRAVQSGDRERARRYVERAARLPFDRHEEEHPLAGEAHMLMFNVVIDELEACDQGDTRWLDAALTVLAAADESLRCELRDALRVIDKEYEISRRERSALRSAITHVPQRAELSDLAIEPDELVAITLSLIEGCVAYVEALNRLP
jgi:hypothetical protein